MPPIAGTARLENDIESWSSAVRISGRLIGTVPISATAVAKFVSSETIMARTSHQMSALLTVSHSSCGLPTWLEQGEDGDERADRHHEVGAADPVELLERGSSVPVAAAAAARTPATSLDRSLRCLRVGAHLAAERGRLQVGERVDTAGVAEALRAAATARSLPTMSAVLTSSSATSAARRPVAAAAGGRSRSRRAHRPSAVGGQHDMVGVEAPVRDPGRVQRTDLLPEVRRAPGR